MWIFESHMVREAMFMNSKNSVSLTVKIVGMAVACIIITMIAS